MYSSSLLARRARHRVSITVYSHFYSACVFVVSSQHLHSWNCCPQPIFRLLSLSLSLCPLSLGYLNNITTTSPFAANCQATVLHLLKELVQLGLPKLPIYVTSRPEIEEYMLVFIASLTSLTLSYSQNMYNIQILVVLLVPGLTSSVLSLAPLPTSTTENSNLPVTIPLPSSPPAPVPSPPPDLPSSIDPCSEAAVLYSGVPFTTRTFSHACPTGASGDADQMHSVLNTFFQAPVSGEEKKRRLRERIASLYLFSQLINFVTPADISH